MDNMALSGEHQGLCPELWLQGVWCLHGRDRCGAVEGQHFGTLAELCLIWLLMGCGLASSKGCFCGSHCYTRYACFWILSLSVCLSVRPSVCLSVSLSLSLSLSPPFSIYVQSFSTNWHAPGARCQSTCLEDLKIEWVLLGHSERREYFLESNELLAQKLCHGDRLLCRFP